MRVIAATLLVLCASHIVIAQTPQISVWGGPTQSFGTRGHPQRWVNILGNVTNKGSVTSLTYTLNGGQPRALNMGPDVRRLRSTGDFNIDIDRGSLNNGANTVAIKAVDSGNNEYIQNVTVNYTANSVWPGNYDVDWSTAANVSDVVQIVDGQWAHTSAGARPTVIGYDRTFALGDVTWQSFEVLAPMTVNAVDTSPAAYSSVSISPGFGFIGRWTGHTQFRSGEQPLVYWLPKGAGPWYDFGRQNQSPRFWLGGDDGLFVLDPAGRTLSIGIEYWWKLRVESMPNGHTWYGFKMWQNGGTEPALFDMKGTEGPGDLQNGSVLFVAHHVDLTVGNIRVSALNSDTTPPLIAQPNTTPTGSTCSISWLTDELATGSVSYGKTAAYGSTVNATTLATEHTVFLSGLDSSTAYHFKITAADGRNNATSSQDLVFRTSGGGGPTNIRVMPLGDSITASSNGFASYRYFLWHQLQNQGYCVDFVGSKTGVRSGTPKYANFDQDYEGGWGLRADQIADQAYAWAAATMPDVVLCHAGIDDVYQSQSVSSTIADLSRIIDELRRAKPDVKILMAQLNPFGPRWGLDVVPLNAQIPGLVASKTTAQSPVVVVDHFTGWNTSIHTHNDIHSNELGEQRMAGTWYDELIKVIPPCGPTAPVADFAATPTTGGRPLTVAFTDQSTNAPTSWAWEFGDGGTSTAQNPSHDYTTAGIFTVKLVATNATGSDTKTRTNFIIVTNATSPTADFTGTPTSGSAPLTVAFADQSPGSPTAWVWNFGDGNTSTARNPSHVYNTPGTYSVQLTVSNASGSDSKTRTDYIAVGTGARVYKVMPFGDSITEGRNGWATYRYFLWQQLQQGNRCVDFVGSRSGVRSGSPKYANFDQHHEAREGYRADEMLPFAYSWVLAAQPDIILAHVGSNDLYDKQDVPSTISDIGALIDEFRRANPTVTILLAKIIPFGPNFSVNVAPLNNALPAFVASKHTAQSPVILVDHFSGWNTAIHSRDDVHPSEVGEIRMANTWNSELLNIIPSCSSSSPAAEFVATPTNGLAPLNVSFTDQSSNAPTSWAWEFGDGGTSNQKNPSHVYGTAGTYTVKLVVSNAGGTGIKTRTNYITVSSPTGPTANFTGTPTRGGAPLRVAFTDQSTGSPTSWAWSFGDGSTSSSTDPTHTYTSPGTYSVVLVATNPHGSSTMRRTDYIAVTNTSPPTADFNGTPTIGDAPLHVDFADLSTNSPTSWSWDFGDGGTSITRNPGYDYTTPGTYTVKLTATNANGSDTRTRTAYIVVSGPSAPTAGFAGTPRTGDAPLPVTFTDQTTGTPTSWVWAFGDGATSSVRNPSHTYTTPGTYTVTLTAANTLGWDQMIRTSYVTVTDPKSGGSARWKIMPLGDSITASSVGFASYRYFLWHQLMATGRCVEFVGSKNGVRNGAPKYTDFDQSYEGGWGLRADQLADQAFAWAREAEPDVVLCHAGIDDVYQNQSVSSTIADLSRMIDELRRANPNVIILLAQLNPFGPRWSLDVVPLNNQIPGLAASKTTSQSPVLVVDHFTGWDTSIHTHNDIHSNELGEQRMANTWHETLKTLNIPTCDPGPGDLKVMPLGDSITASSNGFASYRYFLWHQLKNSDHCVDFVGSKSGVRSGAPKYSDFDQDYEGGWGLRADQIADNAYAWAVAAEPNVVLCHAGIDDVYESQDVASTIADLERTIDELRRANPDVIVLLAQLNPFGSPWSFDVVPLNNEIPELAARKTSIVSPVIVVDHFTGWNPAIHTHNGIHSNELGEQRMANTWHDAILALDLKCRGTLRTAGNGCGGRLGTPSLRAGGEQRPMVGHRMTLHLGSLPAGAPIVGVLGFSDTSFHGTSLPLELTHFGMPHCWLHVSPDFLQPLTAGPARTAAWQLPVLPSAAGLRFFAQAFVGDPGSNARGMTATNALAGTLGVR